MYKFKKEQTGTALIICLMLLTISTIVALNAVSSTVLEEKMAGNIRNKHVSFQAAEAAVRAGELVAQGLPNNPAVFNGTNGLYPRTVPGDVAGSAGASATFPVWNTINDMQWRDVNGLPASVAGQQTPTFIIENFALTDLDDDCGLSGEGSTDDCDVPIYRITARGTGLNTNQPTIIQTTFRQF